MSIEHIEKSQVGAKTRTGAIWSVVQIAGRNIISLVSTTILARMLAPDAYGLIGMVGTLTALLNVFSDMGLSWATIQRSNINSAQVSNLFWINTTVGLFMWVVCILLAPFLATFYSKPELSLITVILGATFFIGGISVQPFALLRRRLEMRVVAEIEITSAIVAAFIGVLAAVLEFSYWALVAQALTTQIVRALLVLLRSDFVIEWPRLGVGTFSLISFGGLLALNGLLIYFARTLDSILIAKVWGAQQLGFYDRAYFLMLLPSFIATGVLTNLMVPSLSVFQNDLERFGSAYRRAVRLVAFTGCPMAVGLALTAPELVQLMYGKDWEPVVPMLAWLSIAGITQPIYNTTGWLFTAAGQAKKYFYLTVINAVVLAGTFIWAVQYGAIEVAMGYGLVMGLILWWPALWLSHTSAGLRMIDTVKSLMPVAVTLVLMAISVYLVGIALQLFEMDWLIILVVKVAAGIFVYGFFGFMILRSMIRDDILPLLPKHFTRRFKRC